MNAGVPPIVRVEGAAEEVSQVMISCSGGTRTAAGSPIPAVTVDITLNTNVTSRLLDASRSEALLLLDEPSPAEQVEAPAVPFAGSVTALGTGQYKGPGRPNVFGAQGSGSTSLRWSNIPFDPPGNGTSRVIRLVNIRGNASQLGVGSPFSPSQMTMTISATAPLGPALIGQQLSVAFVQSGMSFSTTPATYQQCAPGSRTFPIVFTELFGTAFRHAAAGTSQNIPGSIYNTESMFFNDAFTGIAAGAGKASQGTRLRARFSNVPANVTITVPTSGFNASGDAASLVTSGTSGSTANASTGAVALAGGAGTAVWEVTSSNPGAISVLSFAATVTYGAAPAPGLGAVSMIGDYAPIATTLAASSEAAPRFVPGSQIVTPFTIATCTVAPTFTLSQYTVEFTANSSSSGAIPGRNIYVARPTAASPWSASSDSAWLGATPYPGVDNVGVLWVQPLVLLPPGTYTGRVTVSTPDAPNSPLYLSCIYTVTGSAAVSPKVVKVSGDGQLTTLFNGFTLPLVVRVEDAAGLPITGTTVTWTEQGGINFGSATSTTTDSNGMAQMTAIPAGYFNPGTPFLAYSITATSNIGTATFNMTSYPVTGVSNYNPPPLITLVKPTQENRTITAKLGSTTVDAIRALVVSGGGNATNPTVIPNVSLNVSTGNTNPVTGIVARCEGGTPLSGADGIVSCNLIVEGRIGSTALLVNVGALRDFPGVQLSVTPGDPVTPIVLSGNNQTGAPGATLPTALMVRLVDAYGNPLPATAVSWTVVPANAATLLNPSTQSDASGNVSAQVRLGSTPGAFQVKVAAGGKEAVFTLTVQGGTPSGNLSISRNSIALGATANGTARTSPQEVFVTVPSGSSAWTAVSNAAWLGVTPGSGVGSGKFNAAIVPSALPAAGTYSGTITVNASGAANGPLAVTCTLTVKSGTTPPYGSFDTPLNNTTGVFGSLAVTGWALDDIGVSRVTIWRDRVGPEPVNANGFVYIGDALFVAGARPDIETAYPTAVAANRAGWGYLMLTYGLPNANGTFRLHAIAVDEEGNQVELGARTITVDNLHSIKPFGAIDSPAPGETVSGVINNNGWALTPQPKFIASGGSTIFVNVDGVDRGHPGYGSFRGDILAVFPGYANSSTSAGSYLLNTAGFTNGMHSISWNVYDNLGQGDGIGSRFFHIQNSASAASADPVPVAPEAAEAERVFQLRTARLSRSTGPAAAYPAFRQGYHRNAPLTPIRQAGDGLLEPIALKELDRLEIHLPGGQTWAAAMRVGDESRALPIGSTFDAEGGIFYWQLGPGFLGEFTLEFRAEDGAVMPILVRVGASTTPTAIQ